MSQIISVDVQIDILKLYGMWQNVISDPNTMLAIHNAFYKFCSPYVPFREGVLDQTAIVTPEYVLYNTPYAHYMYTGEVYGPNIPKFDDDGDIEGWWSPPGKPKHPTGRKINYNKEFHPSATDHWDKKMMIERGDEFTQQVQNIINRRAVEYNGS